MRVDGKSKLSAGLFVLALAACEGRVGPFGDLPSPSGGLDPFAQPGATSIDDSDDGAAASSGAADDGFGSTQQPISLGLGYHDLRDGPFVNTGAAYHWVFGGRADNDPAVAQGVCRSGALLMPFQPYLEKPLQDGFVAMFATTLATDNVLVAYANRVYDFLPAVHVGPGTHFGLPASAQTVSTLPPGFIFHVWIAHTLGQDTSRIFSSHLTFAVIDCP